MDQPKIERMLRMIQLLASNTNYTLDEIADKLELSRRSMFRYIDTFKSAGFVVQRISEGVYKITSYDKEYKDLSQLVYFSEEEAIILSHLIENLDSTNSLKAGLKHKLAAVYDSTSIADYIDNKAKFDIVEVLADAVKNKRQVRLKSYSSAHAGKDKDYIVEPYKFTKEFVDIIAYDTVAGISKVFKISRIGGVEMLGGWENESQHVEKPIDSFRMSGSPIDHVKLRLSLRAKNLLTEEFPVTFTEVSQAKRTWFWEGDVNSFEGIGRFVLGLAHEVSVVEGKLFKKWLQEQVAYSGKKFGKKLCPDISPNKSWAGFWGGLAFSILAVLVLRLSGLMGLPVIHGVILAAIMHVAGVYGDLFESQWKRSCGVKDSGNIIPGHGGMLDRFDSAIFAVPAGAIYLSLLDLL